VTEYRYLVLGTSSGVPSFCPDKAAYVIVLMRRDETGDYMLEVLKKHIVTASDKCSVSDWLITLDIEEQAAFNDIKDNSKNINLSSLYTELNLTEQLPFKLTAFRSHLRGYCTCPKN